MKKMVRFECEGNPEDPCGGLVEFEEGLQEEFECPHGCNTVYTLQALRSLEVRAGINELSKGSLNPKTQFVEGSQVAL